MTTCEIRTVRADDAAWITKRHGELYAHEEGFDDSFEPLVASILDDFFKTHDPICETGWIAHEGETPLGCIFCVRQSASTAKLRLFLVEPSARGLGIGQRLLETCTHFARDANYNDMSLWTHESHVAACALYTRNGWEMVQATPVRSFGQDLIEQTWVRTL